MPPSRTVRSHTAGVAALATTLAVTLAWSGTTSGVATGSEPPRRAATTLDLGARDLPETRHSEVVQPGVTVTTIRRGTPDPDDVWTAEVASDDPADPDPDAPAVTLTDRATAEATAADLRTGGLDPRVEAVRTPRTADFGGLLGHRVRVGRFATKAEATAAVSTISRSGLSASAVFTGWDGEPDDQDDDGVWDLSVVTIDPKRFDGRLQGAFGPDFVGRETTSALARADGATVAVNGGYFVLDPAAGAPGDPAGVAVFDGRLRSEPVDGRPALVLRDDARGSQVRRLWWRGSVTTTRGARLRLDGLNRVPGLVRNCGQAGAEPTSRPQQDVTCTRSSDLVAFDRTYGSATPPGLQAAVVLDRRGRVSAVDADGGSVAIPATGTVLGAIGPAATRLRAAARTDRMRVRSTLTMADGRALRLTPGTTIVNGGPVLVRDGRVHVTPDRDGAVHPGEPSFYYGWGHKRNPRTFAGVDRRGRLVLVTADGRSERSLGLGLRETAAVARSLGLVTAMNLDGGGSTTTVVRGRVVNVPSDATGERPVGDVVEVLPRR